MGIQSQSVNFFPEANFRVIVDGETNAGDFTKAGPLNKSKIDVIAQRGGGSLTELSKEPGNVTYEPVVLEQGASDNTYLEDWHAEIINAGGVTGNNGPSFKRQVRIEQLNRDKTTVLKSWTYDNCWPSEYDDGGFDAESSKNRTRMVKLEFIGAPTIRNGE